MLVPKLRFNQDNGLDYPDWEEQPLSDICETILGGGTPATENKNYWNGNIAWVSSSDLKDNNIHQLSITRFITKEAINVSATKLIPCNSVLIVSRVGVGKVAVAPCELCTSQDFTNIVNPKCNSMFLGYLLSVIMQHKANGVQGTSIKGITAKEIKQYKLYIPHTEEQQKIANFLSTVDEVITQSENEVKNLEQQKKGVMQKIFSQEVRFRRDDGTEFPQWKEEEFGTTVMIERGGSPRPIKQYITDNEGYNWVKIGDAPEYGRYITHTAEKIKKSGLNKTRQVFKGDLILSNSMSFGKPYIMAIDGCIHDGWLLIRNNQNIYDLNYLCHLLGTEYMLKQYKSLASGSTVNNLNKDLVSMTTVLIPCLPEQQKIADFLSAYDEVITYAKQELEHWKRLKKGLLQQMFV